MAKFDACLDLPEPSINQGVIKSTNRYGCYYARRQSRRAFKDSGIFKYWNPIIGWNERIARRTWLKRLAQNWRTTMSQAQRDAWDTLAAGVTMTNNDGQSVNPNGFQLYIASNTLAYSVGLAPPYYNTTLTKAIRMNPPASWDPPPAPIFGSVVAFYDYVFYVEVTNFPDFPWTVETFGIKGGLHSSAAGRRNPYYTSQAVDWYFDGDLNNYVFYFSCDYPLAKQYQFKQCTINLRFSHLSTGVFSNPTWIEVPG
jgi:hypothetical protein